jgi:hypothetical protein
MHILPLPLSLSKQEIKKSYTFKLQPCKYI